MQRFRQLKQTAKGISMVKTPGQKAFGLQLLENSRDVLSDLGQIALFTAMLEQAKLPVDIRNIDISTDFPDQFPREPRVEVPQTAMYDDMSDFFPVDGVHYDRRAFPRRKWCPKRWWCRSINSKFYG